MQTFPHTVPLDAAFEVLRFLQESQTYTQSLSVMMLMFMQNIQKPTYKNLHITVM